VSATPKVLSVVASMTRNVFYLDPSGSFSTSAVVNKGSQRVYQKPAGPLALSQ
jgi:hypothetical protein